MPTQGDYIRDWILPIGSVSVGGKERRFQFLGTAFGLASIPLALTAAHVVKGIGTAELALLTVSDGRCVPIPVIGLDQHPSEDVLRLELTEPLSGSPLTPNYCWQGSSLEYTLWGYPIDAMYDRVVNGAASPRPDLVFSAGHIRRRIAEPVPLFRGDRLFELSTPAGSGCSGAPVLHGRGWEVVGIYLGEVLRESENVRVGYAARLADLADWMNS